MALRSNESEPQMATDYDAPRKTEEESRLSRWRHFRLPAAAAPRLLSSTSMRTHS